MIRAAVDGVVDYTKADLDSPQWHRRLGLLLGEMAHMERRDFTYVMFQKAMSAAMILEDVSNKNQQLEYADTHFRTYFNMVFDIDDEVVDNQKSAATRLRGAWTDAFGDPEDPKTRANIDAVVAALESRKNQGRR